MRALRRLSAACTLTAVTDRGGRAWPSWVGGARKRPQAGLNESVNDVYKLLFPIWERGRQYDQMSFGHLDLHECCKELHTMTQTHKVRYLASYFRVAFFGKRFELLNGREYIYREKKITRLNEITNRLERMYVKKFGEANVEIIGHSSAVEVAKLSAEKVPGLRLREIVQRFALAAIRVRPLTQSHAGPYTRV